jgi:hypothetical protein
MARFVHRAECSAGVLLHRSQVVRVPVGYEQLWPQLDGSLTLRHIERQYGSAVVDWVGALHREGMVAWSSN